MAATTERSSRAQIGANLMACRRDPSIVSELETTELRVFGSEPLPHEVERWIDDWATTVEHRCDVYLIDDRHDVGIKRRSGTTLELKVRHAVHARMELGDGLVGCPEVWQKWSPADGLVQLPERAGPWTEVDKEIVRRRFDLDGVEHPYSVDSVPGWPGCDVEVVRVGIGAASGWTLALTAFGPSDSRLDALVVGWAAVAAPECARRLVRSCRPMGYPEWLADQIGRPD